MLSSMEINGLKCDAEGCDYTDETVEFENYEKYVNTPCPKCGANLLTQQDLDSVLIIKEMVDNFNSALEESGYESDTEDLCKVELSMCGDGSIEFGEIKCND